MSAREGHAVSAREDPFPDLTALGTSTLDELRGTTGDVAISRLHNISPDDIRRHQAIDATKRTRDHNGDAENGPNGPREES